MNLGALDLAAVALLSVLALGFALRPLAPGLTVPLLARGQSLARRRRELVARKEGLYAALRELEADHAAGRVAVSEYEGVRTRLVHQAARCLQALDEVASQVERAIQEEVERLKASGRETAPEEPGGEDEA